MPCFLQVIAKMLHSEDSQMCPRNTVSTLAFNIQKQQRGTRRGSFCSCRKVANISRANPIYNGRGIRMGKNQIT